MEVANLKSFAESEIVDIDNHTFGDFGVDSLHFELLHRKSELTTGFHTFGVAFELNGNLNHYGLGVVHFEEVDVHHGVLNGIELDVFEDSHFLAAVEFEFNCEDVGSVDEFADSFLRHNEVGSDKAFVVADFNKFLTCGESAVERKFYDASTIEDNGDETLSAESLSGFFAKVFTSLGFKSK